MKTLPLVLSFLAVLPGVAPCRAATGDADPDDVQVAVYYFPNWGPENASEWASLKRAQPRFEGHAQPEDPAARGKEQPARLKCPGHRRHGMGAGRKPPRWLGGHSLGCGKEDRSSKDSLQLAPRQLRAPDERLDDRTIHLGSSLTHRHSRFL